MSIPADDDDPWQPNREQRSTGPRDGWLILLLALAFIAYAAWTNRSNFLP